MLEQARLMGYPLEKNTASGSQPRRIAWIYRSVDTTFDFSRAIFDGFHSEASNANMEIILTPYFDEAHASDHTLRDVVRSVRHIDGALISSITMDDPYLAELDDLNVPIILWDITAKGRGDRVASIEYDSVHGAEIAVEHLIGLGHRRIGFLNGLEDTYVAWQRLKGYQLALCKAGIPYDPDLVTYGTYKFECAAPAMEKLLRQDVTAVFCAADIMAAGCLQYAHNHNIRVPEDLSIVGYDDNPLITRVTQPRLTTVRQDLYKLGRITCGMMSSMLSNLPMGPVVLPPELVIGDSSCPPRSL